MQEEETAMNSEQFRTYAHELVDWMADYLDEVETYPVSSRVRPGEILDRLPQHPPLHGEPFDVLFRDFQTIIVPGITHWQHPKFFGYFPANSSRVSILAEMLTATLGAQCMSWATSPAAAELEERTMSWLREMIGLPDDFTGAIQDTASTATICALATARERHSGFTINRKGLHASGRFTVYCSPESHSSIEKAVKAIGLGADNLRRIPVDDTLAMAAGRLHNQIDDDIERGCHPLAVVAALGTTGTTAIDPLKKLAEISERYGLWLHVDAAFAGAALLLPEYRWMIDGIKRVDSFVFNPHKWMFTNFDCSAYFVRDTEALVRTFEILPEYLKTNDGAPVKNYRDWGLQLGRRFRALKLWFVIRNYGVDGLREKIRRHIGMAQTVARIIDNSTEFELMAPVPLNTICFRLRPPGVNDVGMINAINEDLMDRINASGKMFLTHTRIGGMFVIRMVIGQTEVEQRHVDEAWEFICETAELITE
jgi:aromatic-L-amino-acid/L-tryptophan decarboxylase